MLWLTDGANPNCTCLQVCLLRLWFSSSVMLAVLGCCLLSTNARPKLNFKHSRVRRQPLARRTTSANPWQQIPKLFSLTNHNHHEFHERDSCWLPLRSTNIPISSTHPTHTRASTLYHHHPNSHRQVQQPAPPTLPTHNSRQPTSQQFPTWPTSRITRPPNVAQQQKQEAWTTSPKAAAAARAPQHTDKSDKSHINTADSNTTTRSREQQQHQHTHTHTTKTTRVTHFFNGASEMLPVLARCCVVLLS